MMLSKMSAAPKGYKNSNTVADANAPPSTIPQAARPRARCAARQPSQ